MKLSTKAKTIIAVSLFLVVLLTLILVATFLDYQISDLLTDGALADGQYYANDFFGVLFECVGSMPIYLLAAFVCCILFWWCLKVFKKKPINIILAVVFAIGSVVALWFTMKDAISYIFDQVFARANPNEFEMMDQFYHSAAVVGVEIVFALIMAALALIATKHFNEDTLKGLFKFCIAAVVAAVVANVLIMIIKDPVGRMRFRAINSIIGQDLIAGGQVQGYTPWYITNGQQSDEVLKRFELAYMVEDAFKSFPSGHTCAAGSMYALILLPEVVRFKRENVAKAVCWSVSIAFTMLVAISRIVVGAHYMSDVTFGGTIAFLCFIISREIFLCKGKHFFALFPALQKGKKHQNVEIADEQVQDVNVLTDVNEDVMIQDVEESVVIDVDNIAESEQSEIVETSENA